MVTKALTVTSRGGCPAPGIGTLGLGISLGWIEVG